MVDVVPQNAWILYRSNKDEGDESRLALLAFQKDLVNVIFLKCSKKDKSSLSHVGFEMSHQMFVMMTQNITRCHQKCFVGIS